MATERKVTARQVVRSAFAFLELLAMWQEQQGRTQYDFRRFASEFAEVLKNPSRYSIDHLKAVVKKWGG